MSWLLRDDKAFFQAAQGSLELRLGEKGPSFEIRSDRDRSTTPCLCGQLTPYDRMSTASESIPAKLKLGDAYVRQSDLIAVYPELAPCRFGYQVDVKYVSDADGCLITEFWISIQTSLLDAHPQMGVNLFRDEFASIEPGLWVGHSHRLGLLVHSLDQSDCRFEATGQGFGLQVFGRFMEKGVIRRMRFRLIAAKTPKETSFWLQRMDEFSNSPLPLTT